MNDRKPKVLTAVLLHIQVLRDVSRCVAGQAVPDSVMDHSAITMDCSTASPWIQRHYDPSVSGATCPGTWHHIPLLSSKEL